MYGKKAKAITLMLLKSNKLVMNCFNQTDVNKIRVGDEFLEQTEDRPKKFVVLRDLIITSLAFLRYVSPSNPVVFHHRYINHL